MSEKYPRMPHLPWSPGCTKDDRMLASVDSLLDRELVISEKADGSNICLERANVYARSHNEAPSHESFDALKALHATLRWQIPERWQVFGEWLWARHSIVYDRLPAYLLVFGIRDTEQGKWLSWEDTADACATLNLQHVPVLWRGIVSSEAELRRQTESLTEVRTLGEEQEGVVVRLCEKFANDEFSTSVAKWVRPNHVKTNTHWSEQKIERNRLLT